MFICCYSNFVPGPSAVEDAKFTSSELKFQNENPVDSSSVANTPTRKKFKDLFPQLPTTPLMTAGPTLYEDTMKFRVS